MTREYKIPVKAELLPDTAVKVDTGLNTRLATEEEEEEEGV